MPTYIGEIQIFAGNFAPGDWALCDGQLLAISSNDALFALIGNGYGGDGRTTFGLPDLRGRVPIHQGQGSGLTNRVLGNRGGHENVVCATGNIPAHTHSFQTRSASAAVAGASPALAAAELYAPLTANVATLDGTSIEASAPAAAHENQQPFLALNYIISLSGIFPSRS
jgi:microcystin-dependent protein